ncbi:MAG: response regulator, partial [Oligoflexales bacterium]|nr:response regulator [Oligoflexales bacterium]
YRKEKPPGFGYTNSTYWIRVFIKNEYEKRRNFFLELAYHYHDFIEFYEFNEQGLIRITETGDHYSYYQRPVDHQNFVFPVTIEQNGRLLLLLRSKSANSMAFPLILWTPEIFQSAKSKELITLGIYYGIIAVMILYNFFLFLLIRDYSYFIYVLYVISYLIYQTGANGLDFRFLWPENIFLANFSIFISISLVDILFPFFTQVFLQTKKREVIFNYLINVILYPWAITGLIFALSGSKYCGPIILSFQTVAAPLVLVIGTVSWVKGYRSAKFYVIAFSVFLIGSFFYALKGLGILPLNIFTEYSGQMGSAAEIVLLSFALGDKIRIEQKEAQKNIEELNNNLEKKVEEKTSELKEANRKLTETDKYKTSFFQNISHELRTPLTLILNPIENAMDMYPSDKNISTALKNSKRLLRLVNQLLDFQKYSIAGTKLDLIPVDLTRLIVSAGDYFREAAAKRNVEFILKINDEIHEGQDHRKIFINGQVDALEKIIFNYLSNALKYVRENGEIILSLQHLENEAVISVRDNGMGITDENMKKLFKLFSQADDQASRSYEGTGIGLALTKELTEGMGGTVDAVSVYGEGSCFSARFPVLKVEMPVIDLVTVLGDGSVQEELVKAARSAGEIQSVRSFSDLLEVGKTFGRCRIETLLTDHTMLGVLGNKVLKEIHEKNAGMKIFLLRSGRDGSQPEDMMIMDMVARGFAAPWDISGIAGEISRWVGEKRKDAQVPAAGEHKIKDWLLADTEVSSAGEKEIALEDGGEDATEHILVVDDNMDMLHLVSGYLREDNYRVSTVLNGKEALDRCQSLKPDLIITDWMMPVMSGPELLQNIKEDKTLSSIPVILLTAKSDETSKKEGTRFGADAFLGKPFDHVELSSLVRNLLKLKKGEREITSLNREIAGGVLRRFLPPELIEQVLKGDSVFDRKPKNTNVTILIATLSHFKDEMGELGPENFADLMNDFYTEMTKIIFSNHGIIDRLEDGSIRALFGVPVEQEPEIQSENAARSALDMEKRLFDLMPKWNKTYGLSLSHRMIIHQGKAVVGMVGSLLRTDYTAAGPEVNFIRSIEGYVKDGEILITKQARDYLRADMWVRHEPIDVQGSDKKLTVARVTNPASQAKKAV